MGNTTLDKLVLLEDGVNLSDDYFQSYITIAEANQQSLQIFESYTTLEEVLEAVGDVTYFLESDVNAKNNYIFRLLASLTFKIWFYGKSIDVLFPVLGLLEHEFTDRVNKGPVDEDTFLDFTKPEIIKLFALFDIPEIVTNGVLYNNGKDDNENVRKNMLYYKECLVHLIRLTVFSKYTQGKLIIES